jgi:hypothetical protein
MRRELLACTVLHADETPVAQLDPGAGRTKRAYLFAYRTAVGTPIVLFDYHTSRSGEHVRNLLGEWRGALMVDDYVGYKASFAADGMVLTAAPIRAKMANCCFGLSRRQPQRQTGPAGPVDVDPAAQRSIRSTHHPRIAFPAHQCPAAA